MELYQKVKTFSPLVVCAKFEESDKLNPKQTKRASYIHISPELGAFSGQTFLLVKSNVTHTLNIFYLEPSGEEEISKRK